MDWLILNRFWKLVTWSMASGQQKRRGVDPNLSWRAGSITIRETSETVCQTECLSHCGSLYSALSPLHCLKFLLLWALVICKLVHNSFVCSVAPPAFFSYIFSARLLIQLLPYFQWFSRPTSCVFGGSSFFSPSLETLRSLASFVCFSVWRQKKIIYIYIKRGRTVGLDW